MSRAERMTRLDRIKQSIDEENDLGLTDEDRLVKEELLVTSSLLLNPKKTMAGIVKVLKNEHGLSDRTAFSRIRDAKLVFGDVFTTDRALDRMKAIQRAELAWAKANKQDYTDGMTRANEQISKLQGLDKDDRSAIDPTQLAPSEYRLLPSADAKKVLKELGESGVIDLGDMMQRAGLVTDAKVEEVPDSRLRGNDDDEDDDPIK